MMNSNTKIKQAVIKQSGQPLFETVEVTRYSRFVKLLSLGLFDLNHFILKSGFHYLVVTPQNQIFYYDRGRIKSENKYLLFLNVDGNNRQVMALPTIFRQNIIVHKSPIFDENNQTWFNFDYDFSVVIKIPTFQAAAKLYQSKEQEFDPLEANDLALKKAARTLFSKKGWQTALIMPEEILKAAEDVLKKAPMVKESGLEIIEINCRKIEGDPELLKITQEIHRIILEANSLDAVKPELWRLYLEKREPGIALRERTRVVEIIQNGLIAMNLPFNESDILAKANELGNKIWA